MKIYEINKECENLLNSATVDEETGEVIFDNEAFEALQVEFGEKMESLLLAIKNKLALAGEIKAEEEALAKRRKALQAEAERLTDYAQFCLQGQTFETAKCSVTYKKTPPRVDVDDEFIEWAKANNSIYLRKKESYEPDKTAIKDIIKMGGKVPHAQLVAETKMVIK